MFWLFSLGIHYSICINSVPVSFFLGYLEYMEIHYPFFKNGEIGGRGCGPYVNLCRLMHTSGIFFPLLLTAR